MIATKQPSAKHFATVEKLPIKSLKNGVPFTSWHCTLRWCDAYSAKLMQVRRMQIPEDQIPAQFPSHLGFWRLRRWRGCDSAGLPELWTDNVQWPRRRAPPYFTITLLFLLYASRKIQSSRFLSNCTQTHCDHAIPPYTSSSYCDPTIYISSATAQLPYFYPENGRA